jgi:hypothetical protein
MAWSVADHTTRTKNQEQLKEQFSCLHKCPNGFISNTERLSSADTIRLEWTDMLHQIWGSFFSALFRRHLDGSILSASPGQMHMIDHACMPVVRVIHPTLRKAVFIQCDVRKLKLLSYRGVVGSLGVSVLQSHMILCKHQGL